MSGKHIQLPPSGQNGVLKATYLVLRSDLSGCRTRVRDTKGSAIWRATIYCTSLYQEVV